MSGKKTYYQILRVSEQASRQDIQQAYYGLVRPDDPDGHGSTLGTDELHTVQEAYEVLSDPDRRREYDQWRNRQGSDQSPRIRIEITPSHRRLPALDDSQLLYTYVEVLPGKGIHTEPLPLNLCLILDRSTSMQGESLSRLKQAVYELVDLMDERDVLSVITFSDRPSLLVPAYYGTDGASIKAAVARISAGGGTEIFQGLRAGLDQLLLQRIGSSVDHMILLTDGQTYGDEDLCLALADEARRDQVRITALGMGLRWNDSLLDAIGRRSNGTSAFIERPDQITSVFQRQIKNLQAVFAQRAILKVWTQADVRIRGAFQVLPTVQRLDEYEGELSLGDLGTETPNAYLLEWVLTHRHPGEEKLISLTLETDIPSLEEVGVSAQKDVTINFGSASDRVQERIPEIITKSLERIAAFKLHEKAQQDLEEGNADDASKRLEHLATRLLSLGDRQLAQEALIESRRVSVTGMLSPMGQKRLKYGTRTIGERTEDMGPSQGVAQDSEEGA